MLHTAVTAPKLAPNSLAARALCCCPRRLEQPEVEQAEAAGVPVPSGWPEIIHSWGGCTLRTPLEGHSAFYFKVKDKWL